MYSIIETQIDLSDSCHENDTRIQDIEKKRQARVQVPNYVSIKVPKNISKCGIKKMVLTEILGWDL